MNSRYFVPIIFLGTAVGQIRRGEDGLAIGLLCAVAVVLLVNWFFDEASERDERKREEARRKSRY